MRPLLRTLTGLVAVALVVGSTTSVAQAEGGAQRWSAEYAHGAPAFSADVVVSPDGSTVFVTGATEFGAEGRLTTLAYDAATGVEKWTDELRGRDRAESSRGQVLAISPDGETLFVAGYHACSDRQCDSYYEGTTVLAYDAATGRRVWDERMPEAFPSDLEVTRDGSRLVVYGRTGGGFGSRTTTLSARDGRQMWSVRADTDLAWAGGRIALSRDGSTVFVGETATSDEDGCYSSAGYRTSAYAVVDGDLRWSRTHRIPDPEQCGIATDVQVAPDGSSVFVTGYGGGGGGQTNDVVTVAYDAGTGAQRWVRRDPGLRVSTGDIFVDLAVDPTSSRVIASGSHCLDDRCRRTVAATTAYDADSGERAWRSTYDNGGKIYTADLAMSADGSSVFITGQEHAPCLAGCHTVRVSAPIVAYDARTGQERWVTTRVDNTGEALAVGGDGASVYLAGTFTGSTAAARAAFRGKGCTTGRCGYTTARHNVRAGAGTFQETDAAVSLDGWRGRFDGSALGGAYRASSRRGDAVTFRTPATEALAWLTRVGPRAGKARITVDGKHARTVDLYATRSGARSIAFDGLPKRRHTVAVRVLGKKSAASKGRSVAVDGFSYAVRQGLTQETSPQVRYNTWDARPSVDGSARASGARSAKISFTFRGRSVRWLTVTGRSSGRARVAIDGRAVTVDLYRPGPASSTTIPFTDLGPGRHRISIAPLGRKHAASRSKEVLVDGFVVRR